MTIIINANNSSTINANINVGVINIINSYGGTIINNNISVNNIGVNIITNNSYAIARV